MSRFAVASCACLLLACRDDGEAAFTKAKAHYDSLILAAQPPGVPAFDEVMAELDAVPAGSKRAAEARKLKQNILNARVRLRAPLSIVKDERSFPPDVIAQLRACNRLAELAGPDGGLTRKVMEALDDCRQRAEKLELEYSHGPHAEDSLPPPGPPGPEAPR